ncbi:hypothetical protein DSO57_1029800 [Entomophthora muscae]|uniref:Uncharacterized protein n=1 Tax=Entomophthora muscae TaxID=34485 RepID=A0ACC2T1E5_9FUNG|nr:hypothetical protein DSO57_1029800 [Entomophthora muscae]
MKRKDCKDASSPSVFLPHICDEPVEDLKHPGNPDPPRKPPSSPLLPRMYMCNSKWNPCHPNRFVSLEIEDELEIEDHYPCLPDLNKYLSFKDGSHYNIVTVESVPEPPRTDSSFSNLPSDTPSLVVFPAGAAAWGHRATGQKGKKKAQKPLGAIIVATLAKWALQGCPG